MCSKASSLFLTLMLIVTGCAKHPSPAVDTKTEEPNKTSKKDKPPQQQKQQPEPVAETFTHVVAVETEYYMGGPMQGRPPEGNFSPGTKVRMTPEQKIGIYVLVKSESGIEAYVSSGALKPIEE